MDYKLNETYLILGGHLELYKYRYLYFIVAFIVYSLIIILNLVIFCIIYTHRILHEPMYIFIAVLSVNSLIGSTALYPKLLVDLLSENQCISYPACALQAFVVYMCGGCEYTLLSVMAYDRYVSICEPLHYSTRISKSVVTVLLFGAWFCPACETGIAVILTNRLTFCTNTLNRIYCDNYSIVKLSCSDTSVNFIFGLFLLAVAIFLPAIFIVFSYIRIIRVCFKSSKDFRRKSLQTCLPHLLVFSNTSVLTAIELIQVRLENRIPHIMRLIISLHFMVIPPLFNPLIYGLIMKEISNRVRKLFICELTHRGYYK